MTREDFFKPCEEAYKIYQASPYGDMWRKISYHELVSIAAYKARRATLLDVGNPKILDDILDAHNFLVFGYLQAKEEVKDE